MTARCHLLPTLLNFMLRHKGFASSAAYASPSKAPPPQDTRQRGCQVKPFSWHQAFRLVAPDWFQKRIGHVVNRHESEKAGNEVRI